MKKILLCLMIILCFAINACDDAGGSDTPELSESEKITAAKAALEITFQNGDTADSVTQNITLPSTGLHQVSITWTSDNEAIITANGVVTPPETTTEVTITAELTLGSVTESKNFTLNVIKKESGNETTLGKIYSVQVADAYKGNFFKPVAFENEVVFGIDDSNDADKIFRYSNGSIEPVTVDSGCDYHHGFGYAGHLDKTSGRAVAGNNLLFYAKNEHDENSGGHLYRYEGNAILSTGIEVYSEFYPLNYDGGMLVEKCNESAPGPVYFKGNTYTPVSKPDSYKTGFSNPCVVGSLLYFAAENESGNKLYFKFNGSVITELTPPSGITYWKEIDNDSSIAFGDSMLFSGSDDSLNAGIFKIKDSIVTKIDKSADCDYDNGFFNAVVLGDRILFKGYNNENNTKVYQFNGSKIINGPELSGGQDVDFENRIVFNNKLYVTGATDGRLYSYDGSTFETVAVEEGCSYDGGLYYPVITNSRLVFGGYNGETQGEGEQGTVKTRIIYVYDGTSVKSAGIADDCDYKINFEDAVVCGNSVIFSGRGNSGFQVYEYK